MRNIFRCFCIFFLGAFSLLADEFKQADALFKESVRVLELSAKTESSSVAELEHLDKLCQSAKAYLTNLQNKIALLKKSNSEISKENEHIVNAIKNDIQSLDKLSKFIDEFYCMVLKQLPQNCSLLERFKVDTIKNKTVPEKLRTTLSLLDAIKKLDSEIVITNGEFSTGLFVKASGKISANVSKLKTEVKK